MFASHLLGAAMVLLVLGVVALMFYMQIDKTPQD